MIVMQFSLKFMNINKKASGVLAVGLMALILIGCGGGGGASYSYETDYNFPNYNNNNHVHGTNAQFNSTFQQIGNLLENRAYAFGAGFENAKSKLNNHKASLAQKWGIGPYNFAGEMSRVMKQEFGVSHCHCSVGSGKGGKKPALPFPPQVNRSPNPSSHFQFKKINHAGKHIAYMRLPDFSRSYSATSMGINMASAQNCSHMIVDLRGNPGGYVVMLTDFLRYFVPSGSVVSKEVEREDYNKFKAQMGRNPLSLMELINYKENSMSNPWGSWEILYNYSEKFNGRLTVLVDRNSASCSETFASAVKDLVNAQVIGTTTAKACLTAVSKDIGSFSVTIPVADCVSPSGQRIEGVGVQPTVYAAGNSYQKALNWIASH